MKHLFFIQSAHTELIALAIIKGRNLDIGQCLLICLRSYEPYSKINSIKFPVIWRSGYFRALKFAVFKKRWIDFKNFLETLINNEKFCVYLPQFTETFIPFIVTHPKCMYFSHIEEGLHTSIYGIDRSMRQSLGARFEEVINHWIMKLRFKRLGVSSNHLPYPCFSSSHAKEFFRISNAAYLEIQDERKIKVNLIDGWALLAPKLVFNDKYLVLPIDSLEFSSDDEIKLYFDKFYSALSHIDDWAERKIVLKAHPKTRNENIIHILKNLLIQEVGFRSDNISQTSDPLEMFFDTAVDAVFIGGVSSVLVYAAISQKLSISFAKSIHTEKLFSRLHHNQHRRIEDIMSQSGVVLLPQVKI